MSGLRTAVDGTDADARDWERNREAWNLPRATPSEPAPKLPEERVERQDEREPAAGDPIASLPLQPGVTTPRSA